MPTRLTVGKSSAGLFKAAPFPRSKTINPTGFRWKEVRRHYFERGLDVPALKRLSLNFRSSGSIVELSNVLLELKEKYLGIKAEEGTEEWRYKGRPVAYLGEPRIPQPRLCHL